MTRLLPALVALALLAVPAAATAQAPKTNAPPGNSAIDEYLETVPGASGNQRPRTPATGGGAAAKPALSQAERARLERLGPDGRALADAVDATAPPKASRKATETPLAGDGRSPLSEVLDAATGDDGGGGMGVLLPTILLATVLGAIALVVLRRRSAS